MLKISHRDIPAKIEDMKPIPISAARNIADQYGYDQVIIVGRKVGDDGGEHCTTYGKSKLHCAIAA